MPLHIDYRPQDWDDFEGNIGVVQSLRSKLEGQDCPHAFLFTGPSGCGKTTLGRMVAISLGALNPDNNPQKELNYRELDASDFRGIDTIREIRRTMHLSPIGANSRTRVFLLDECHQLTKDAQEALLKALEDSPNHVYFILATTDPGKLKPTLKRRCMDFDLKPIDDELMSSFLMDVVKCEKKKIEEGVLDLIIEKSEGSPGRALIALDKVIDLKPKQARAMIKSSGEIQQEVIDLCRSLIKKKKWKYISSILRDLKETGQPAESTRIAVFNYCSSILIKSDNPRAYLILDAFRDPIYDPVGFNKIVLYAYEALYAE